MKVDLVGNRLAMWIVCEAIKGEHELINKMMPCEDNMYDITFAVNGVELNFLNVINRIDEIFDQAVEERAGQMYIEKFDRRSDEIAIELDEIKERLKFIRETKFPEINWRD